MKNFILVLLLLPLHLLSQSRPTSDWRLRKDERGIKVYSRAVEGSDIDELKVVSVMHGSLSSIASVILDVGNYPNWIYSCKEAKVLKQVSSTEQYQYQRMGAPYPFADRDIAIHFTIWQDPKTKIVYTKSQAVPDYIPDRKDIVRLPVFDASYALESLGGNNVQVTYNLKLEAGGYIPDWLVNMTIVTGPFESTIKMQKEVEKVENQNKKLAFIQDP